jgi:K+-transporting ATPase A subunit
MCPALHVMECALWTALGGLSDLVRPQNRGDFGLKRLTSQVKMYLRAKDDSTGLSASLLVRLGIATSASPTGSMLVVTDDLHPMGTYRTLFQLVPNLIPVGSG